MPLILETVETMIAFVLNMHQLYIIYNSRELLGSAFQALYLLQSVYISISISTDENFKVIILKL